MKELKLKLINILESDFTEKDEYSLQKAEQCLIDIFKSLGDCDKCYGKGYMLVDLKKPEFCACDRGKSLKEVMNA